MSAIQNVTSCLLQCKPMSSRRCFLCTIFSAEYLLYWFRSVWWESCMTRDLSSEASEELLRADVLLWRCIAPCVRFKNEYISAWHVASHVEHECHRLLQTSSSSEFFCWWCVAPNSFDDQGWESCSTLHVADHLEHKCHGLLQVVH